MSTADCQNSQGQDETQNILKPAYITDVTIIITTRKKITFALAKCLSIEIPRCRFLDD